MTSKNNFYCCERKMYKCMSIIDSDNGKLFALELAYPFANGLFPSSRCAIKCKSHIYKNEHSINKCLCVSVAAVSSVRVKLCGKVKRNCCVLIEKELLCTYRPHFTICVAAATADSVCSATRGSSIKKVTNGTHSRIVTFVVVRGRKRIGPPSGLHRSARPLPRRACV